MTKSCGRRVRQRRWSVAARAIFSLSVTHPPFTLSRVVDSIVLRCANAARPHPPSRKCVKLWSKYVCSFYRWMVCQCLELFICIFIRSSSSSFIAAVFCRNAITGSRRCPPRRWLYRPGQHEDAQLIGVVVGVPILVSIVLCVGYPLCQFLCAFRSETPPNGLWRRSSRDHRVPCKRQVTRDADRYVYNPDDPLQTGVLRFRLNL